MYIRKFQYQDVEMRYRILDISFIQYIIIVDCTIMYNIL